MSATSTQGGAYLLDAFGAAFIGASTVRVGQFHIPGTFIGVLIVVLAVNGLVILMVPGYLTDMIKGIILLLAIMLSGVVGKFLQNRKVGEEERRQWDLRTFPSFSRWMGSGLGAAIAERFVAEGAKVCISRTSAGGARKSGAASYPPAVRLSWSMEEQRSSTWAG